ncbi:MAG: DNA phosphorothioation-associated protein 4 [Calothrix sp. C42_A2020_038]|nr:DNA phosphorothioation-associated protein 4 [Calothrix sp. C42_A2020_038]
MTETGKIRIAKDKAELVKSLTITGGKTGAFQTYADVIVFAATLGAKHKKRVPLEGISKKEPGPIRLEQFISMGYDIVIKLLAVVETQDIKILSLTEEELETQRNQIFEEYANGGLEILQGELRGSVDYLERILLLLSYERAGKDRTNEEFDLSRFLY